MTKRIAVLLSGRGSNFEALADGVAAGRIPNAEIAVVISNRDGAPGIDKAPVTVVSQRAAWSPVCASRDTARLGIGDQLVWPSATPAANNL